MADLQRALPRSLEPKGFRLRAVGLAFCFLFGVAVPPAAFASAPSLSSPCERLLRGFQTLKPKSLTQALASSDVNAATLATLKNHSAGVVGLKELFQRHDLKDAFVLGLSGLRWQYNIIVEYMHFLGWQRAYYEVEIDPLREGNMTPTFMERLTALDHPIVFLVPNATHSYGKGDSVTLNEFHWLLQHPDRMKNVTFVFGAYDLLGPEFDQWRDQAGYSKEEFIKAVLRVFKGH